MFSVGGGNLEKNVSVNLVRALVYAKSIKAKIIKTKYQDVEFHLLGHLDINSPTAITKKQQCYPKVARKIARESTIDKTLV